MKIKIARHWEHSFVLMAITEEMYKDIRDILLNQDYNKWYKTICAEMIWKPLKDLPKC